MCVLSFSPTVSGTFLILRRIQRNIIINVYWSSSCKVPAGRLGIQWDLNLPIIFFFKYSNITLHEYPSNRIWLVSCRWTDRQTDMMRLIVTFQKVANVPKKDALMQFICYGKVQTPTAICIMSSFFVFVTIMG